ncbi:MAG: hypothetical protein H6626_02755 [Pseudobdellovibrionaceae bacterium]|nr:MAG: hypothetical protein H6626_02755 [Pseudobdellovibrionaceae bacterium]
MKRILLILISFAHFGCSSISKANQDLTDIQPCRQDVPRQKLRSEELQTIVKADQDDRENFNNKTQDELFEMLKRDITRRKRVGEIFGEGCFKDAKDFSAAALVYQHGDVPDHFFQAFIWAKRAVDLGDKSQKHLMALAIDRYLVNIGHKQLFASQASKSNVNDPNSCWCMQQIEKTFPEKLRIEGAGKSLTKAFDWLEELNQGKNCPNTECDVELSPSPKGTVPGFW